LLLVFEIDRVFVAGLDFLTYGLLLLERVTGVLVADLEYSCPDLGFCEGKL
jgi:hypothetical protein